MFSYLSSDSDNDSTNNDDVDGLVESISSPPLTNDVNSSQSTSISKRKFTTDVWQTFSIKADKAICKCGESFAYKADGSTGTSSLKRHLLKCLTKPPKIDVMHSLSLT
jgi:hypothetical protein